jgi:hypothetical protein
LSIILKEQKGVKCVELLCGKESSIFKRVGWGLYKVFVVVWIFAAAALILGMFD